MDSNQLLSEPEEKINCEVHNLDRGIASRTYAITMCLPKIPAVKEGETPEEKENREALECLNTYLDEYLPFYCKLERRVYQDLNHGVLSNVKKSEYISAVTKAPLRKSEQDEPGVLKRTVNSIIFNMQGRISALLALMKTEYEQLSGKLSAVDDRIEPLQQTVDEMKALAGQNRLSKEDLEKLRESKESLYHLTDKRNRLKQKMENLEKKISEGKVSMCFGTKKLFSKQHHLEENGYRSSKKWHNDFVKKRDAGISLLGAGCEKFGNQILQLRYNDTDKDFTMVLLKDKPFRPKTDENEEIQGDKKSKKAKKGEKTASKVIVIKHLCFPYMQDELQAAIQRNQPITYRISKKHNRWYLTAMFSVSVPLVTTKKYGVFGVDFNNGFLEVAETNEHGNMVSGKHIELKFHGSGTKAESEIKEKLSKLVRDARDAGKDIIIEDLDFAKKKSKTLPGKCRQGKQYNKMVHALDYSRYRSWTENLCKKYGVGFQKVNPAYTSRIGKEKYATPMKLTIHRAAALVIARRGQGFKDRVRPAKRTRKRQEVDCTQSCCTSDCAGQTEVKN